MEFFPDAPAKARPMISPQDDPGAHLATIPSCDAEPDGAHASRFTATSEERMALSDTSSDDLQSELSSESGLTDELQAPGSRAGSESGEFVQEAPHDEEQQASSSDIPEDDCSSSDEGGFRFGQGPRHRKARQASNSDSDADGDSDDF